MRTQTISIGLAAAALIVAGGLVLLTRAPSDEPTQSDAPLRIAASDTPIARDNVPALAHDAPAAVKIRELEAMSETFRNTSFLIAIRDAGYDCAELLRVSGGIDDSGKWTAGCSEMQSYTLAVAGNGTLRIEPMLQYSTGPTGL